MKTFITRSPKDIETAYQTLLKSRVLGCDTETSGLHPKNSELFSVQFSDGEHSVLVPTSEGIPLEKLSGLLENDSIVKIFHNSKFDLSFLIENGYRTANVYDTMIAEKVITKGANQSVSLADTLYRYFAVDLDKSQRKKFGRNWDKVWTVDLVEYAMNDVVYLPRLMNEQLKWMERLDLVGDYEKLMQRTLGQLNP